MKTPIFKTSSGLSLKMALCQNQSVLRHLPNFVLKTLIFENYKTPPGLSLKMEIFLRHSAKKQSVLRHFQNLS